LPEWLVERGIGETRAALLEGDEIVEARIHLDGVTSAGSMVPARLTSIGIGGRNAVATDESGTKYLLPRGAPGVTEGAALTIEVTREAIPGNEPWKRPLARVASEPAASPAPIGGVELAFPAPRDAIAEVGWNELVDEARSGIVGFAGGELRLALTPAMTLIDVDGHLPPQELAVRAALEAARAIRRLDIGGSIGIDLPTIQGKSARQAAASALDAALPQPFERTAMNGFGFIQVVRPRRRASILELAQDRAPFEARALLRRAAFEGAGPKRLVANPAIVGVLSRRGHWIDQLARQLGGAIELRSDAALPISGGYAEAF
jgi:ribonuclease G